MEINRFCLIVHDIYDIHIKKTLVYYNIKNICRHFNVIKIN